MSIQRKVQVLGFSTMDIENGCDAEFETDTFKDAKKRARYMLSEDYRVASESSQKLTRVIIKVGDEIWHDMF